MPSCGLIDLHFFFSSYQIRSSVTCPWGRSVNHAERREPMGLCPELLLSGWALEECAERTPVFVGREMPQPGVGKCAVRGRG